MTLGKYSILKERYTEEYLLTQYSLLETYDAMFLYEMCIEAGIPLVKVTSFVSRCKEHNIDAVFKLVSIFKFNNRIPKNIRQLIKWCPDDVLTDIDTIISSEQYTISSRFSSLVRRYIRCEFEKPSDNTIFERIRDVVNESEEFTKFLLSERYIPEHLLPNTSVETVRRALLLDINDDEFTEYYQSLSDDEIESISTSARLYTLYKLWKIARNQYCDEYLKICCCVSNIQPPKFLELAVIHHGDINTEMKRAHIMDIFKNYDSDLPYTTSFNKDAVFFYFYNNDIDACVEHMFSIYPVNTKQRFMRDCENILQHINYCNYSFLTEDEYIKKSFLSFRSNVNMKIDEILLKRKDKQSEFTKLVRQKLAQESDKIIKEYIESDFDATESFYSTKYPNRNARTDKQLVQEFFPETYERYSEKVKGIASQRYAVLNKTANKLRKAIENSKYNLSLLDFCKIYNPFDITKYFTEIVPNLSYDNARVLKSYYKKIRVGLTRYNTTGIISEKLMIANHEFTNDEKEAIINYIKQNKLPRVNRIYKEICRLYAKGEIDLTRPFISDELAE